MPLTNKEYDKLVKKATPPTKKLKNCLYAFLFGGLICAFGEVLGNLYRMAGMTTDDSKLMVTVTLIFLAAVTTGLTVYDDFAKIAGAGSMVPITGFANSIVSPALEFKSEGHVMGIGAKMFTIAGPVLVFGISSSVIYGLILCLIKLL